MALFASLYEDFEKLPPAGKVIASAAVVGVAILGVARFRKGGSASGSSSSPTLALPSDPGYGTFTVPGGPPGNGTTGAAPSTPGTILPFPLPGGRINQVTGTPTTPARGVTPPTTSTSTTSTGRTSGGVAATIASSSTTSTSTLAAATTAITTPTAGPGGGRQSAGFWERMHQQAPIKTPKSTGRQNPGAYDRRNPAPVHSQRQHPVYQQLHQATRPPRPQQMF